MSPIRVLVLAAGVMFVSSPPAFADDKAAIAEIKKLYAKIDAAEPAETTKIKFDLPDDPMEGTITRFTYEGGLSAIKLSYIAGDHGGADEHYYYHQDKLFFIFAKDFHWQFGPDSTAEKPTSIDILAESRYYIHDGSCIRALQRSVRGTNAKELTALISKTKNEKIPTGGEREKVLLEWARGLRKISSSEEAVKLFSNPR